MIVSSGRKANGADRQFASIFLGWVQYGVCRDVTCNVSTFVQLGVLDSNENRYKNQVYKLICFNCRLGRTPAL
jgi:hypothetical protein